MTEELRSSFAAQAKAAAEECKVHIRRVRQEARGKLRALYKDSSSSEGSKRDEEQQLQQITDAATKQATQLLSEKLKQLAATRA
ncbi:ribosome recycling factor domain-containing protein, putative [Eimeria necatrix]|uniref:Ribosome recycling factor domain-containing protein, putative n=1 Tax=Eimeria necatrix TaxID=51315 RepID=U6MTV3_9EIME|nr:ribosome recycling factor domain-containing protein, putative [Eimeria necatrix]CDJ67637.1 ribosome recycling factor domain-containing protein, putative [Eimeria necatrix]